MDDFELYRRWMGGDVDAGRELVERHHSALLQWLYRRTPSACLVNDLANEVWARAMAGDYGGSGAFRGWLLRIARTQVTRQRRRASRHVELGHRSGTSPSQWTLRRELRAAVEELSNSDQRRALELHFLEDLSPREVAEQMSAPEATTRSRIRLALDKLRRRLTKTSSPQLHGRTA